MSELKVKILNSQEKKLSDIADIIKRIFEEKHSSDKIDITISLKLHPDIGAETFNISHVSARECLISGGDFKGLLYGAGKLLRTFTVKGERFDCFTGIQSPVKPFRGIYLATHFHNFYQDAPIEKVYDYIEELALWGCNVLSFWFDLHHYQGIDDPKAVGDIAYLRKIADKAKTCGMDIILTTLANEAYYSSPEKMRAEWQGGQNGYIRNITGHYHCEVCPNKPEGLDYILATRKEMLERFRDFPIDYISIGPYDQGGCTCAKCSPWGSNGFLKTAEALAPVFRKIFPDCKIILATWRFDQSTKDEWRQFAEKIEKSRPDWLSYIMSDNSLTGLNEYLEKNPSPCGIPILSFPEITSMRKMLPWGGFGANPAPFNWEKYFNRIMPRIEGIYAYSEGLHDDINKVICLQKLWNPKRNVRDIVEEYVSFEFSSEYRDDIVKLIFELEKTLGHKFSPEDPDEIYYVIYNENARELAGAIFTLAQSIDQKLSQTVRNSWRWRILYLRAALDAEIIRTKGKASDLTEKYLNELTDIYHVSKKSRFTVAPPVLKRVKKSLDKEHEMDD